MKLPKFIITMDGVFRLGMVEQHKHLLKPGDQCIGNGYYTFLTHIPPYGCIRPCLQQFAGDGQGYMQLHGFSQAGSITVTSTTYIGKGPLESTAGDTSTVLVDGVGVVGMD